MNIWAPMALAVAIAACWPAAGADLASAKAFLTRLYAHYPTPEGGAAYDPTDPQTANSVFDPSMVALLRRDRRLTSPDEVGALDGDPICDCQDDAGLKVERILVHAASGGRATAVVTLRFEGDEAPDIHRITFDLDQVRGQWRVHDIAESDTPSLRALLTQSNAEERR